METREQLQLLVRNQGEITGFSYAFCRLLVDKLKLLYKENRVFVEGIVEATKIEKEGYLCNLQKLAENIISYLDEQIPTVHEGSNYGPLGISKMIEEVNDFLAIFEKEG